MTRTASFSLLSVFLIAAFGTLAASEEVGRFGVFEAAFEAAGQYANPYTDLEAEAEVTLPGGQKHVVPLFWDGDQTWKLRISPDLAGAWRYTVRSKDTGLDGKSGTFTCVASDRRGSIQPQAGFSHHFQYQNGEPMWFMGDTAWGLFTDSKEEQHDRAKAEAYLRTRAAQGFNVVHSMLLSEAGWGNSGGLPWVDLGREKLNPRYWREVEERIAYANSQSIVVGLALAWGDKRRQEPFAWRRFPDTEARKRYARYIAARYGAYDVYFIVSGEWHAEVRARSSTPDAIKAEFIEIGDAIAAADPHDRMIAIHPMTQQGSVREFNDAAWMAFGDYQQNYRDLHARLLLSREFNKPLVNAEYGYHLRDSSGDGKPDKDNSTSLESIRRASWDIVMAGAYLVTGFGTTYFGGNRDPGPFNLDAPQNDDWERQIGFIKQFFTGLDWWTLEPRDAWLACKTPRGADSQESGQTAPPETTYWLLADPGSDYVAYARGLSEKLTLDIVPDGAGTYRAILYSPITGESKPLGSRLALKDTYDWTPPDDGEWVLHLAHVDEE